MKKFKNIYIEITNICNLNCSFCPKTDREPREMTAVEFSHILDKVIKSTEYIYLHVVGEPLTHSGFDKILSHCDEKNAKIKLTTNGTLLKENLDLLISHPSIKSVNISLSCIKDFSETAAQAYLNNVLFAATALSKSGITTTLRTWIDTKYNNIIKDKINEAFNANISLSNNGVQKITDRLLLDTESEFIWPVQSTAAPNPQNNCLALRKQIAILSDGTVVPCCLDNNGALTLGNIFTQPLEEILSGERAVKIAQGFQNAQAAEPFCKTCTFPKLRLPHKGTE